MASSMAVPHVQLDELAFLPDWVERPTDEFCMLIDQATQGDRWVACGNYTRARPTLWPKATDIVWLNYPFRIVYGRAIRRTFHRTFTREELYAGNRESFRRSFLSTESILVWILKTYHYNRRKYALLRESPEWSHLRFTELRHPREADAFLAELGAGS